MVATRSSVGADIGDVRGTCYGYSVRSALPLQYLRDGCGSPELFVDQFDPASDGQEEWSGSELVETWEIDETTTLRLQRRGSTYRLDVNRGNAYDVETSLVAPSVRIPATQALASEERMWGVPLALCLLARGDVSVHSSAVDVDGTAVVFGGPSGGGKTTLAAAFVDAGHRLLSEDGTCMRLNPVPQVVPGPALLRLRHDIAERWRPKGAYEVGVDADRVHLAIDVDRRGDCEPVPLGAVVLLQGGAEQIEITRLRSAEALAGLYDLQFQLSNAAALRQGFAAAAAVARSVPIYSLRRPMNLEWLDRTVARLCEVGLS